MIHLRRTFLGLCSTLLVIAGVLGQGFVLCVPTGEAARLEVSDDNGKCVRQHPDGFKSGGVGTAELIGVTPHNHGCEDIALTEAPAHLAGWSTDTYLTAPAFVVSAAFPATGPGVQVQSLTRPRRLPIPDPVFTDVHAVRTTVSLLI